jgi:Tol biopolymer transport system component
LSTPTACPSDRRSTPPGSTAATSTSSRGSHSTSRSNKTGPPDGQRIAFTGNANFGNPGDSANIATIGPDGTDLHYLTHYQGGQVNAFVGGYSPDGNWIVFRLEDHGLYGLYRMRSDGSNLHAILDLSSFKPRFIDWGPRATQ